MGQSEQTSLTGYNTETIESTNNNSNNQVNRSKKTKEFNFDDILTGDKVTLSTLNNTVFEVTRIEEDNDLVVSGDNNFVPDVFAQIRPVDDNNISNRYIVKSLIGEISVWRTAKTGGAKKSTATRDITIKKVLSGSG